MKPLSIHIKAHDYLVNGKDRAKKLFSITDVEGVRMNPDDPASVISEFPASDFDQLVGEGVIRGGMIPKILFHFLLTFVSPSAVPHPCR